MTRFLVGIDDTDAAGGRDSTNRLGRQFEDRLPAGLAMWGALGHRLNPDPILAPTTKNTAVCVVIEGEADVTDLARLAADYVGKLAETRSQPGICVIRANDVPTSMIAFGRRCCVDIVGVDDARQAAGPAILIGLSGEHSRGLIGAVAAVGLTAEGWSGRLLEFGRLRQFERAVQVADLLAHGILPVSLSPDAEVPAPEDWIDSHDWLRPRLIGGRAVLPVEKIDDGLWNTVSNKKEKAAHDEPEAPDA